MKTGTKLLMVIGLVAFFCAATSLQAHDLIPPDFRGLPATVFSEFEFETGANPAPPIRGDQDRLFPPE